VRFPQALILVLPLGLVSVVLALLAVVRLRVALASGPALLVMALAVLVMTLPVLRAVPTAVVGLGRRLRGGAGDRPGDWAPVNRPGRGKGRADEDCGGSSSHRLR
jgi:hypothetical protein